MPRRDLKTTIWLFMRERLMELIHAGDHPPYLSRHRADAVVVPVRLVSAAGGRPAAGAGTCV